MFENGDRPQAVIMVVGVFELDMSRRPRTAHRPEAKLMRYASPLQPSSCSSSFSWTRLLRTPRWCGARGFMHAA
jgi:hypothetical protein